MSTNPPMPQTMGAKEILQGAYALIADPSHFCQHSMARNVDGLSVPIDAPDASRWCALGALDKIGAQRYALHDAEEFLREACATLFDSCQISVVNDRLNGHTSICQAFALALEWAARSKPAS